MSVGVIVYGPPASGKDTVTRELAKLSREYLQFQRLKAGDGRTEGYRLATAQQIARLREAGECIWENERYGATYVVDRSFLASQLSRGVPVLHLGQPEAISAVRSAFPDVKWVIAYLWCSREVAEARVVARATGDSAARMEAWDATEPTAADLSIDTGTIGADAAAGLIHEAATRR